MVCIPDDPQFTTMFPNPHMLSEISICKNFQFIMKDRFDAYEPVCSFEEESVAEVCVQLDAL